MRGLLSLFGVSDLSEKPATASTETDGDAKASQPPRKKRRGRRHRRWWRLGGGGVVVILLLLVIGRAMLPWTVRSYVNRTLDQDPRYDGKIGDIDIHLWRGAYSIKDVRLVKTSGNVPAPLFSSERLDLAVEWPSLLAGKVVGRVAIQRPEINFVDSEEASNDQTGAGGPWLQILEDLFPFRINSLVINDGSIHFRAVDAEPPVDVFLADLNATVKNLSNIHDDVAPLVATVEADAKVMGHAPLEYQMKFDPFSYRPTFQMALRLVELDVTKLNDLTRAFGAFDFERGWFDLVVEAKASEGQLEGYVKPLFRNLTVLSLRKEIAHDNVIQVFWEALVGVATEVLENQPRDQFGTVVNFSGDLANPRLSVLEIVFNVLHNAFIRAYVPRLHGEATQDSFLQFTPGSVSGPVPIISSR